MPYPPPLPPNNRANTTPQFDNHPSDHNVIAEALAAILAELGNDPSGAAVDLTARLGLITPVGSIVAYGGAAAPTNWLLCNGASLLRSAYPALFSVLSTAYGSADSTHFTLPDLQTRVPVGKGTTAPFTALNAPGGNKDQLIVNHLHDIDHTHTGVTVAITAGQGSHRHGIPANRYVLSQQSGAGPAGGVSIAASQSPASSQDPFDDGTHNHNATVTFPMSSGLNTANPTGGAAATNMNLQPYIVVNYIIKALP